MKLLKRIFHFLKHRVFIRPYLFRFFLPSKPVSRMFGYDRGLPIDRYYIDRFYSHNAQDIQGDVLEVGDPGYAPRFGKNYKTLTILHYEKSTHPLSVIGNLERHETLPKNQFDCFICPQTFQYIYDFEKGVQGAFQMLREDGVLLATLPAISQTSVGKGDSWNEFWRFREEAIVRGFGNIFGASNIKIESFGNVKVGVSFYYGLSLQDISKSCLDKYDPDYPFLFTVRAVKQKQRSL